MIRTHEPNRAAPQVLAKLLGGWKILKIRENSGATYASIGEWGKSSPRPKHKAEMAC